ncbi:hypothetical protein PMIN06_011477 [Paraphaeosphaeria minitans]
MVSDVFHLSIYLSRGKFRIKAGDSAVGSVRITMGRGTCCLEIDNLLFGTRRPIVSHQATGCLEIGNLFSRTRQSILAPVNHRLDPGDPSSRANTEMCWLHKGDTSTGGQELRYQKHAARASSGYSGNAAAETAAISSLLMVTDGGDIGELSDLGERSRLGTTASS